MPVGPISSRLWRSAIQVQAPEGQDLRRLSRRGWVSTASTQMYVKQVEMAADGPLTVSVEPSWSGVPGAGRAGSGMLDAVAASSRGLPYAAPAA